MFYARINCPWAKRMALVPVAITLVGLAIVMFHRTADAQVHGATRSFSAAEVEPRGPLEVTVSAANFGSFGQVIETLPVGFVYRGSDLPESAVSVEGQTVSFVVLHNGGFSYIVAAPEHTGEYSFNGVIRNQNREEQPVLGVRTVAVESRTATDPEGGPAATPDEALPPAEIPTPAPTVSRPTQGPEPETSTLEAEATASGPETSTPTPGSAATPGAVTVTRPDRAAVPTPVLTATPDATPTMGPTRWLTTRVPGATPTLELTLEPAMPTPTLRPTPVVFRTSGESDDMAGWIVWSITGGVGVAFITGLTVIWFLARRAREDRRLYGRW